MTPLFTLFAQPVPLGPIETLPGTSPFSITPGIGPGPLQQRFNQAISFIIAFLTVVAALFFLFQIFIAATLWLNAGENEKNAAAAKQRIFNALIGIVITVAAYGITALIGALLQLPIFDPLKLFI